MTLKKTLFILIVLAVLGLLGLQIYKKVTAEGKGFAGQRRNPAVAIETKPVRRDTILDIGHFTGTLHARSQFVIAPKIGGRLEKLLVDVGDHVREDQLIAVLDKDEYVQQVEQSRAELEVIRAQLEESRSAQEIAGREMERVTALRKKKIASESELDEAQAQFSAQSAKYKVALAQVTQKKAALKAAEVRLSYATIYISNNDKTGSRRWVVGERFVDEGAMLAANNAIVSVIDIGSMVAVFYVIERDYPKVKIGQSATVFTDAFPGKSFHGKIVRMAPLLKETSRQARVEIEIPNPETLLKPGMFVRVRIEFEKHDNATVIPLGALVNRDGRQGIFLADMDEMKARFVPVTLGISDTEVAEILDPPVSGAVVTMGQHLLEDGSPIILPGERPSGPPVKGPGDGREKGRSGAPPGAPR